MSCKNSANRTIQEFSVNDSALLQIGSEVWCDKLLVFIWLDMTELAAVCFVFSEWKRTRSNFVIWLGTKLLNKSCGGKIFSWRDTQSCSVWPQFEIQPIWGMVSSQNGSILTIIIYYFGLYANLLAACFREWLEHVTKAFLVQIRLNFIAEMKLLWPPPNYAHHRADQRIIAEVSFSATISKVQMPVGGGCQQL